MHSEDDPKEDSPSIAGPALGQGLEPLLRAACSDRLGPITWFRTDWQHGGAATGRAHLQDVEGIDHEVMVKLPVSLRELRWIERLQCAPEPLPIPVLHASGLSLEDYDLAWIIIEWFPAGPLGMHWHHNHFERTCKAAAAFHAASQRHAIDRELPLEDWDALLTRAREAIQTQSINSPSRWKKAHKTVARHLDDLVTEWRAREPIEWLHGDLHLANAMSRTSIDEGPVALIDLAEVRPGHWVEDAVYLERLYWSRPERLAKNAPLKHLATARKALGLDNGLDHARLATIRRTLYAATGPAFLKTEGGAHLDASLDRLEQGLSTL